MCLPYPFIRFHLLLCFPRYLKELRKTSYTTLLTSGKINTYLTETDRQAQERFERLIEQRRE